MKYKISSNSIAIVLSTYNGEKYLQEQLDSLQMQTHTSFDLFIRDDISNDGTVKIIKKFIQNTSLQVRQVNSEKNLGAMHSFEVLLQEVLKYPQYKYIMLCDQDDVWFADKVGKSFVNIDALSSQVPKDTPLLIYSDLEVVDKNLHILSSSFWNYFNLEPSLNSLNRLSMQCNVTGCTMIFNCSLAKLALPFSDKTVMHDHWLGLVASSMGMIKYMDEATLSYRQHSLNVSGGAEYFGWRYIVKKATKYFNSSEYYAVLGRQIAQSKDFLNIYRENLSDKNIEILEAIISLENSSLIKRITLIIRYKLYKQGTVRNIGLMFWLIKMGILSK